jgi:lipoprotein-anchoring transpeptidase ErfK/SrfK
MGRTFRIIKRTFFGIIIAGLLTVSIIGLLILLSPNPPIESLSIAQTEIGKAKDVEAQKYAKPTLEAAEDLFLQAQMEWKLQNQNYSFLRDYGKMLQFTKASAEKARMATEKSLELKTSMHTELSAKLKDVEDKLNHFDQNYAHLPLKGTTRQNFTTARLRYVESKEAFERGAYKEVGFNLDVASQLITKSVKDANYFLTNYFENLGKWRRWADETVSWSNRSNAPAIIVDKFAHKIYVYHDGKLKKEFYAELGTNWIGTKQYRGDKATPEGKYHITKKKSNRLTKYYKALLINYPNDEDQARYNIGVRNGNIPRRGIGNLIEIHGNGGKGINWTDGCVALTDNDIDKLFDWVTVGTPVTIVGSLRSLQEINAK